jgi:hypothetical protein
VGDSDQSNRRRGIPRLDAETERPPSGGDDGDAYSAATVVRAIPDDIMSELSLRPGKLPRFDISEKPEEKVEPKPTKDEPVRVPIDPPLAAEAPEQGDPDSQRKQQEAEVVAAEAREHDGEPTSSKPPNSKSPTNELVEGADPKVVKAPTGVVVREIDGQRRSGSTLLLLIAVGVGIAVAIYFAISSR